MCGTSMADILASQWPFSIFAHWICIWGKDDPCFLHTHHTIDRLLLCLESMTRYVFLSAVYPVSNPHVKSMSRYMTTKPHHRIPLNLIRPIPNTFPSSWSGEIVKIKIINIPFSSWVICSILLRLTFSSKES